MSGSLYGGRARTGIDGVLAVETTDSGGEEAREAYSRASRSSGVVRMDGDMALCELERACSDMREASSKLPPQEDIEEERTMPVGAARIMRGLVDSVLAALELVLSRRVGIPTGAASDADRRCVPLLLLL